MASNKLLDSFFDWGDPVTVKQTAPKRYKPGSCGCICGMGTIDTLDIAIQFDQMIGSELYLVEFSDGNALEIPKIFLVHLTENP